MQTIWKYGLGDRIVPLLLPHGAEVLHLHEQGGVLCMWVRLDPSKVRVMRHFMVVPTGMPVPEVAHYLGTAHVVHGAVVLHVFEMPADYVE
jgi:hypothetical protein